MGVPEMLVWLLGIYAAAGVLFAAWFVSSAMHRMDERSEERRVGKECA